MKEFDRIYAKFINHMLLYGYRPRLLKISIDKYFEFDKETRDKIRELGLDVAITFKQHILNIK